MDAQAIQIEVTSAAPSSIASGGKNAQSEPAVTVLDETTRRKMRQRQREPTQELPFGERAFERNPVQLRASVIFTQ